MAAGGERNFSIAILVGGQSSRMGSDKALKRLAGRPVLDRLIDTLAPLGDDLFLVGGEAAAYEGWELPHCADQFAVKASLVGIYSALAAARRRRCLVVACDLPLLEPGLVRLLVSQNGFDAVVPAGPGGLEPLCALYDKSCLPQLRRSIERGDYAVRRALEPLRVRQLTPAELALWCDAERVFCNLNTPGDLERAERLLAQRPAGRAASVAGPGAVPVLCIVGKKNSGKTTLMERLVPLLTERGLRLAFIKHDVHGFEMDHEGTDTCRIGQAGARVVVISSPQAVAVLARPQREKSLAELCRSIGEPVDLVIVEGYKSSVADKIEISRTARSSALACREEELIAVVSDRAEAAASLPVFGLDAVEALAAFIVERYWLERQP